MGHPPPPPSPHESIKASDTPMTHIFPPNDSLQAAVSGPALPPILIPRHFL